MKRTMSGAIRAAGSLALVGGIIMAAAMPAAAASPNEAYVLQTTGVVAVGPLDEATFPGTSPVTAVSLSAPPLITAGVLTDTADATSASSTVANVNATLLTAGLTADAVTSSCRFNPDTGLVSGTTTIVNGVVHLGALLGNVTLDSHPTRNDVVAGVGTIGSITLNKHSTAVDGTLTVTAIYITLLGSTQTISIGVSVCNDASLAPVPILPSKALDVTLGGLGMLMLGGVAYQVSRRRRLVTER